MAIVNKADAVQNELNEQTSVAFAKTSDVTFFLSFFWLNEMKRARELWLLVLLLLLLLGV